MGNKKTYDMETIDVVVVIIIARLYRSMMKTALHKSLVQVHNKYN